jgi:hypothetical protein
MSEIPITLIMGNLIPQESRACLDLPLVNYTFLTICASTLRSSIYKARGAQNSLGFSNTRYSCDKSQVCGERQILTLT